MTSSTYSILVADDEPEIVKAVVEDLRKLGEAFRDTLRIFPAASATEALSILAEQDVDVLFLDYHFEGGLNGDEIIDRLQDPFGNKVIVLMSARERHVLESIVIKRHRHLGTRFKFLRKPFEYLELQDKYMEIENFFSTRQEIAALIAKGESVDLEFKSSARWDIRQNKPNKEIEAIIVKTVASFLNSETGGQLLIGVDDSGTILGLEHDYKTLGKRQDRDGFENFLITLLLDAYGKDSSPLLTVTFHDAEGKDVCRVVTKPSPKPMFVRDDRGEHMYIRAGNSTRLLSTREAIEYCKIRWK